MLEPTSLADLRAEIAALEVEIDGLYREAVRHDIELDALQDRVASFDCAESEYRRLSTRGAYVGTTYRWFAQHWACRALLSECAGSSALEPPPRLSRELQQSFEMGGEVPVVDAYFAARCPPEWGARLSASSAEALLHDLGLSDERARSAPPTSLIGTMVRGVRGTRDPVALAISGYVRPATRVAVCGSVVPAYECQCLRIGARPASLGFVPVHSEVPSIEGTSLSAALAEGRRFDCVIGGWRVAQAGMGRFDAVAPDGDLELMEKLWRLVAPGGLLIVGLPTGSDLVAYNLARIYGARRLPLLLRGGRLVARLGDVAQPVSEGSPWLEAFVLQASASAAGASA